MFKKIVAALVIGAALLINAPAYAEVNINTATQEQLEGLPGIGPKKAQAIIAGRPYNSVDDLDRVPGIGPKILAQLRPEVTVGSGSGQQQGGNSEQAQEE